MQRLSCPSWCASFSTTGASGRRDSKGSGSSWTWGVRVVASLAAATALQTLELRTSWSYDSPVPTLLAALPALRTLSLHIYECSTGCAEQAVAALARLPRHVTISLGIHAH